MIKAKMIHTMIRVKDDKSSIKFYTEVLGLEVAHRVDFEDFSLIYMSNDTIPYELELTYNHGAPAYDLGNGYGHIAVSVEDLESTHKELTEMGCEPLQIKSLSAAGARFFFITDPDGYKIEFLERVGRYQ